MSLTLHEVRFESLFEIEPGHALSIHRTPAVLFRGEELVLDEECKDCFALWGIRVGVDLFDAKRWLDKEIVLDAASPGVLIVLEVVNVSDRPKKFAATMKGVIVTTQEEGDPTS